MIAVSEHNNCNTKPYVEESLMEEKLLIKSISHKRRAPRLSRFLRWILIVFVIVIIVIIYISHTVPEFNQYRLVKSYGAKAQNAQLQKTATILLWNSFFEKKTWSLPDSQIGPGVLLADLNCPIYNCEISNEALLPVVEYDAIVFHTAQPFSLFNSVPKKRSPHQKYIFALKESPGETKHILYDEGDFYNWTMTYRLDSDILFAYQYLEDIENKVRVAPAKFPPWRTPPKIFNETSAWTFWKTKTHTAAWFVSHCNTLSRREKLAEALQHYIDVDIYGKCGPLK